MIDRHTRYKKIHKSIRQLISLLTASGLFLLSSVSVYASSSAKTQEMNPDTTGFVVFSIGFVITACVVVYMNGKEFPSSSENKSSATKTDTKTEPVQKKYDEAHDKKVFLNRNHEIARIITEGDENFSMTEFLAYVKNAYIEIQDAWTKSDINPVRHLMHEHFFDMTEKLFLQLKEQNRQQRITNLSVLDAHASFYKTDEKYEIVTTYLRARMIDETTDVQTGRLIHGSRVEQVEQAYRIRLVRMKGSKTVKSGEVKAYCCPNCGAAVKIGISEQCPFCKSYVSTLKSSWLIHDMEKTDHSLMPDEGVQGIA